MFSRIMSVTVGSSSVVTSPSSRFSAMSRSKRRMILPLRGLGGSGVTRICRGFAIGPIARPKSILFTEELPKTRSGKIMRRLLRNVAEDEVLGDTTTLADPTIVDGIKSKYLATQPAED